MGRPLLRDDVPIGECKVRALYSWSGDSPRDLGFVEGDIIEVLNVGDGDWWTGRLQRNKMVGDFPRNFAEYCDRNQETMSSKKSPTKMQQLSNYAYVSDPTEHATVNLTDLQIPDPSNEQPSSSKTAEDFLNDVSQQLNGKFLDGVALDINEVPSPKDTQGMNQFQAQFSAPEPIKDVPETMPLHPKSTDQPPMPPPHTVSLNSSRSSRASRRSALLNSQQSRLSTGSLISQNQSRKSSGSSDNGRRQSSYSLRASSIKSETSPILGGTSSFEPPVASGNNVSSSAKTGPQIKRRPVSAAPSLTPSTAPSEAFSVGPQAPVSPVLNQEVPFSSNTLSVRKMRSKAAQQDDPEPTSFFQKIFPKNSQLRRTFSKSSQKSGKSAYSTKSSKSTRSIKSVTSKLKGLKNIFKHQDDDLYPTNAPMSSYDYTPPSPAFRNSVSTAPSSGLSSQKNETAGFGSAKFDAEPLGGKWVQTRRDLYRARSLTSRDVEKRRKELALQGINDANLVGEINEECVKQFNDYRLQSYDEVDNSVMSMSTWPQLMTPAVFASSRIGRHFRDPLDRIRAVFLLCATRISHVSHNESANVMQSRQATKSQLAQVVCDMLTALDVQCLVVKGHVRMLRDDKICSIEHEWNAVNVNDEWRFIDAWLATESEGFSSSPMMDNDASANVNLFYFLTPPPQLVYSHIPHYEKHQFLQSSVTTSTAALLPLASPAAFANKVLFTDFWLGRTRISNLEVCELLLTAPFPDMDIMATICGNKALAQPTYVNNMRVFKVKAFLPPKVKQAVLSIFAVSKSDTQRRFDKLWDIELRHVSGSDKNEPYDFVTRFPLASSDLYILEPQCKALGGGDTYTFKVENFPTEMFPSQPQIAVQSPSGRLTRLIPQGTDAQDTFKSVLKTLEVGAWRGVVKSGKAWTPFCEWYVA